jgi:flavorubredoxin
MTAPSVSLDPYRIAPDTWIIPQIVPSGPGVLASVNSMVIAGSEPVLVDTGCAVNRDRWLDQAFSIVDPADVRWVFISHADRDHIGNLDAVLAACPRATVITTSIGVTYMLADGPPPLDRVRWVNDGETLDVGDRVLAAVRPPMWDASETRGLFDPKTGVYFAADCFGTMLTHPVTDAAQLDPLFWEDSLLFETRAHIEWHAMLDPAKFDAHVERSAGLHPAVIASAHGPVLTGAHVERAFALTRRVARLDPVPALGQTVLDKMVAAMAAAPAA